MSVQGCTASETREAESRFAFGAPLLNMNDNNADTGERDHATTTVVGPLLLTALQAAQLLGRANERLRAHRQPATSRRCTSGARCGSRPTPCTRSSRSGGVARDQTVTKR